MAPNTGPRLAYRVLAVGAGTLALLVFATLQPAPIALPWYLRLLVFGGAALCLWGGLIVGHRIDVTRSTIDRRARTDLIAALRRGIEQAWPSGLALCLLPIALTLPGNRAAWLVPVAFTLAWVGLGVTELTHSDAITEPPHLQGKLWRRSLLGFCVFVTLWFVIVALHRDGSTDNDPAYYFGVARHIAKTLRFEEPIVWHFMVPHPTVLHRPFDYWQGLTSLVLIPPFLAFGPSTHVAMVTIALIDGLALLLFCHLVTVAAPFRYRFIQGAAVLLFSATPALARFRFDTESIPVFHLALLATLVAFAHQRFALAACLAFLLYLTRGDGAIFCGLIWLACFVALLQRPAPARLREISTLVAVIACMLSLHVIVCFALYRQPVPPGARSAALIASYGELFRPGGVHTVPLSSRFSPAALAASTWLAWDTLRTMPVLPLQPIFSVTLLALGIATPRWMFTRWGWLLLFGGSALVVVAARPVFSPWRTLYTTVPLTVLLAMAAVDCCCASLGRWQRASRLPRALATLLCICALAPWMLPLALLKPYEPRTYTEEQESDLKAMIAEVRNLAPRLQSDVVAASNPFYVIALTDSPAVMVPDASVAKIEALFRKYHVAWLMLTPGGCPGEALFLCDEIIARKRTMLGHLLLVPISHDGKLALFRVKDAHELPHSLPAPPSPRRPPLRRPK